MLIKFLKSKDRNIEQLQKLISKKSPTKLKALCEDIGFKGFQNKSKNDLIELLLSEPKILNSRVNKNWWVKYDNFIYFIISAFLAIILIIWGSDIKESYDNWSTNETVVQDPDEVVVKYDFVMFPSKNYFDRWKEDYNFKMGLPKYARNFDTDSINKRYKVKAKGNWVPHPDTIDKRGITRLGFKTIDSLLADSLYPDNYNFIPITHRDAENIGFISDYIEIRKSNIYEKKAVFKVITTDSLRLAQFKHKSSEKSYYYDFEGISIDLIIETYLLNERRNEYIFDRGKDQNQNRISVFFNEDNNICFRVVDNNSDIFMLKVTGQFNDEILFLNFRFDPWKNKLSMEINESGSITNEFSEIDFKDSRDSTRVGNALNSPYYGGHFGLIYLKINHIYNLGNSNLQKIITQYHFDAEEATFYTDDFKGISGIKMDAPHPKVLIK